MTNWNRRTNFFNVDHGTVDCIGVYDVYTDRVGDAYAACVLGFNSARVSNDTIPELEEYAVHQSIMVSYKNVPMEDVQKFLVDWEVLGN